jgi:hypothetical protein
VKGKDDSEHICKTRQKKFCRLHSVELYDLYSSPYIIQLIRSMLRAGNMGDRREAYRILVVKPEGKRPLGRHRRR